MIFQGDVDNQTAENIPSLAPSLHLVPYGSSAIFIHDWANCHAATSLCSACLLASPICQTRPKIEASPKRSPRRSLARYVRCGQLEFSRDFAYSGERKSRRRRVVAATSPPQIGWKIKIRIRWWRRTVYSFEATLSEVHFIVGMSCT